MTDGYLVRPEGYPVSIEGEHETEDAAIDHARAAAQENRHNYIVVRPDGSKLRVRHTLAVGAGPP